MQAILKRADRFLEKELDLKERALVIVAALMLGAVYVFPLWTLTMFAPQYPDGLRMNIYSYKLEGGNGGQDVKEINLLNHYIGMKDLVAEDFTEFKWMPFVVGAIGLLFLRTAVHGRMASLLDVIVLYGYFAAFSLWSFAYKLYSYGHNLAPTAAVKVAPFMPPLFGYKKLANFEVYSYPAAGSYVLGVVVVLLLAALVLAWRDDEPAVMTTVGCELRHAAMDKR
jgi:copper chaperone NosL